jgi:hypothetical protein
MLTIEYATSYKYVAFHTYTLLTLVEVKPCQLVDGVCLVMDATEGPMTQLDFILSKALSARFMSVVMNKVDRNPSAPGSSRQ